MRPWLLIFVLGCSAEPTSEPWVSEVALTVSDLDAATSWFESALGGRRVDDSVISIGEQRVVLRSFDTDSPDPASTRADDLHFQHLALVVDDMDEAFTAVTASGIEAISPTPQEIPRSNAAAAGIRAFYFRGPDGHPLELIWYPAGKGRPAWQAHSDDLVLGIDHTAITVSDTEASLAFYRDALGLTVVGGSFNEGIEQERLSGVDGARVRITSLRGPSGIGLELLEYVAPTRARTRPEPSIFDTRYRETTIVVADLEVVRRKLIRCDACSLDERDLVVLDPDAHPIRLVE